MASLKDIESHKLLFLFVLLLYVINSVTGQCPNQKECECQQSPSGSAILYCARSNLNSVPPFQSTTLQFDEVTLAGNTITVIPANAFKAPAPNGPGLNTKMLDLSDNQITSIDPMAFAGLESTLEVLKLHVNSMASFPTAAIQRLTNLKQIELKGFNFAQLPPGALSALTNLEILSFDSCRLTALSSGDFTSQVNTLKEVYLIGNRFTSVPSAALSTLNKMTKLDLSQNAIQVIQSDAFSNMNQLQELILSQNGVNTINTNAFRGIQDTLKILALSNNAGIVEADLTPVSTLNNLEQLDLSYNSMRSIPNQFFQQMSRLVTFNANNNQISSITSTSFQGLGSSFQTLNLHDNNINIIGPDTFANLNGLKNLNMDNQLLSGTYSPNTFSGLENTLESLSLSTTGFTQLHWSSVGRLAKLTSLKLSKNSIQTVPGGTFVNLGLLQSLNLQSNAISKLKQTSFKGLQFTLEKIYLDNNDIETLDECVFHKFQKLEEIHLDGNPLNCDCQLTWLHDFIYARNPHVIFWQCSKPQQHAGQFFKDVPRAELTCVTTPTNTVCEDYTITTTTVKSTSPSSTTPGSYPLFLNISHVTAASMKASWQLYNTSNIQKWQVKCTDIISGQVVYDSTFPVNVMECSITNLDPSTDYSICVIPVMAAGSITIGQTCTSQTTMAEGGGLLSPEKRLPLILGIVLGVVIILIIIGLVIFCYIRWRNNRDPPKFKDDEGVSNDGSFVPTVGYQSKRFSKPKAHMLINMNGSTPQLDGFTPQERDRILQLFSTSGASTISMLSTQSQRYTGEPYGRTLPPRPGYLNTSRSEECLRHDSGEYNEIPADTYDEIPHDKVIEEGGHYNMPNDEDRPKSTGNILGGASNYI